MRGAGTLVRGDTSSAIRLAKHALTTPESNEASNRWALTALVDAYGYAGELTALVPHYLALVKSLRESREQYWQVNGLGYEAIALATTEGWLKPVGERAKPSRSPEIPAIRNVFTGASMRSDVC